MMMRPTICLACKHLRTITEPGEPPVTPTCNAYPNGIPGEIIREQGDHREPRGDEADGIVFEMAEGDDFMFEAWLQSREEEQ
jgi:hypothetical protein